MKKLNRFGIDRTDYLNAILVDPIADQILRAFELGYSGEDIRGAIERGRLHGFTDHEVMLRERSHN